MATIPTYKRQTQPSPSAQPVYQNINVEGAFGARDAIMLQTTARALEDGQRRLTSGVAAQERAELALKKRQAQAWAADTVAKVNSAYTDPDTGLLIQNLNRKGMSATGMTKDTSKSLDALIEQHLANAPNEYATEYARPKLLALRTTIMKDTARQEFSALNRYRESALAGELAENSRGIAAVSTSLSLSEYQERVMQGAETAREYAQVKGISEEAAVEQYKADTYAAGINFLIAHKQYGKAVQMLDKFGEELDPSAMISTHEHLMKAADKASRDSEKSQRKKDSLLEAQAMQAIKVNGDFGKGQELIGQIQNPTRKTEAITSLLIAMSRDEADKDTAAAVDALYSEENLALPDGERQTKETLTAQLHERAGGNRALMNTQDKFFSLKIAAKEAEIASENRGHLRRVAEVVERNRKAANPNLKEVQEAIESVPVELFDEAAALAAPVKARTGLGTSKYGDIEVYRAIDEGIENGEIEDATDIAVAAKGKLTRGEIEDLKLRLAGGGKGNTTKQLENAFGYIIGEADAKRFKDKAAYREFRKVVQAVSNGYQKFIPVDKLRSLAADVTENVRVSSVHGNAGWIPRQFKTTNIRELALEHTEAMIQGVDSEAYREWSRRWQQALPRLEDVREIDASEVEKFVATKEGRAFALFLADSRGIKSSYEARLAMGKRLILKQNIANRYGLPSVYTKGKKKVSNQ